VRKLIAVITFPFALIAFVLALLFWPAFRKDVFSDSDKPHHH
jgi:hypothetical protein